MGFFAELALGTFRPWSSSRRFSGTLHPNTQGLNLTVLCLCSALLARESGRPSKYWAPFAVGVAFLILTKLRSFGTLHSWFPGYDREFSNYSPGSLLLYEMARLGAAAGITKIDLGKGAERYKLAFANGRPLLAEGAVRRSRVSRRVDASWRSLRTWLKTGPLAVPAKASAKALRPVRERLAFQ